MTSAPLSLSLDVCRVGKLGWLPALPLVLEVDRESNVNQLRRVAEAALRRAGAAGARVSLLFNPSRDGALPPSLSLSCAFGEGERNVLVVADLPATAYTPPHAHTHDPLPAAPGRRADGKIPITVLTGFLGSGKTTLLNHLLHTQREQKIAVIENEFGEVPIDNELLSASKLAAAEKVIVMDNGCMCCSVRGDILGAFASIFEAVDEGKALDAVLIETTGMADPVPIVRTLLQTPAISSRFALTGVVTLCDAKNILRRLREMEEEAEAGAPPDEAFQQLMFADSIVLNKLDLVNTAQALEVWQRLRSINTRAAVLPCVRGVVDTSSLVDASGFDLSKMAEDEAVGGGQGHEHGHDAASCTDPTHDHGHHEHGHNEHGHHEHGHDAETCDDPTHDHGHAGDGAHAHGHGHDAKPVLMHNKHVGSFSLVRPGRVVEPLLFARWMRRVASAKPEEVGTLYRSKAVLAVAGSSRKLVFHAVQDVMEKAYVGSWDDAIEERGCKIVFIGKKLDRPFFEESFDACLVPMRAPLRTLSRLGSSKGISLGASSVDRKGGLIDCEASGSSSPVAHRMSGLNLQAAWGIGGGSVLLSLAGTAPELLYALAVLLPSVDVARLACTCTLMADALLSELGAEGMAAAAAAGAVGQLAFHPKDDPSLSGLQLHGLLPLRAVGAYAAAVRTSGVEILPYPGLAFHSYADLEAAAVTLLELAEASGGAEAGNGATGGGGTAFIVEFNWRAETLAEFFRSGPEASTRSALTKIEVYNEDEDEWDTLKFRLCLEPAHLSSATTELTGEAAIAAYAAESAPAAEGVEAPSAPEITQHRLVFQLVGGKSASQIYMLSFHTIDPAYQVGDTAL